MSALFNALSFSEKRDVILAERRANPTNQMEVTVPPADVDKQIEASSLKTITDAWGAHHPHFDPPLTPRSLALMAILASFTPGQGERVREMLAATLLFRKAERANMKRAATMTLSDVDIKKCIRDTLDSVRSPEEIEEKQAEALQKRAAYNARRKEKKRKNAKAKKSDESTDDTAVETTETELEGAAKKLRKRDITDKLMPSSDEDEE